MDKLGFYFYDINTVEIEIGRVELGDEYYLTWYSVDPPVVFQKNLNPVNKIGRIQKRY